MNNDRELMQQALDALEFIRHIEQLGMVTDGTAKKAITALRERLTQPEQEPVGQLQEDAFGRGQVMWFNKPADKTMLYTTPQPARQPLTDLWGRLPGHLIDKYEGETLTEELLQQAVAELVYEHGIGEKK